MATEATAKKRILAGGEPLLELVSLRSNYHRRGKLRLTVCVKKRL